MSIFREVAGYTYGHADIVRRAMSKKKADVLEAERESFLSGAEKNGIDRETARALFDDMASFANYAFNKSHAAAYAVISYRTAYLKKHFPTAYMAALMTSVLGNQAKLAEYIDECEKHGIHVLPPDVNESHINFYPKDGNIVFGLLALKNVGRQFIESILREREGQSFSDFEDFVRRMAPYDLNKRMVEALIKAGAFDRLGVYRSRLLASYESLIEMVQQKDRNNVAGQLDMFSVIPEAKAVAPAFSYPDIPEFSIREKLLLEKESSGMYFSGHLLDSYDRHAKSIAPGGISVLLSKENFSEKQRVSAAGIISSVTVKTTRKNEKMAFITIEDRYASIECLVFPNVYQKVAHLLRIEAAIGVRGNCSVRDEEDEPKILASEIEALIENERYVPTDAAPKTQVQREKEEKKEQPIAVPKKEPIPLQKPITKLYLRLPDLTGELYHKAINLLEIFDGETPVFLYDSSKASYLPYRGGACADAFLLSELRTLLGEENVVPR